MNPTTATSPATVAAPAVLEALQSAWNQNPPPPSNENLHVAAPPAALDHSFLNLREVPQLSMETVRSAFPMLAPDYPSDWKVQIRQLRNRLNMAQSDHAVAAENLQIITFTALTCGGERYGTAANLALAMAAMQDTRVLVIDANLCAPSLHRGLRIPPGPGLCEATRADRASLPSCFRRVAGSQIYLLTAGESAGDATDSFDLRGLYSLLQSLRAQFDWILIDGPGFDTPADAMAISTAADGVIMMIESERDSFREVSKALGQVQGRRMLGAVMF
jgi:Mrp family chromosome partitioning ATPase